MAEIGAVIQRGHKLQTHQWQRASLIAWSVFRANGGKSARSIKPENFVPEMYLPKGKKLKKAEWTEADIEQFRALENKWSKAK